MTPDRPKEKRPFAKVEHEGNYHILLIDGVVEVIVSRTRETLLNIADEINKNFNSRLQEELDRRTEECAFLAWDKIGYSICPNCKKHADGMIEAVRALKGKP